MIMGDISQRLDYCERIDVRNALWAHYLGKRICEIERDVFRLRKYRDLAPNTRAGLALTEKIKAWEERLERLRAKCV